MRPLSNLHMQIVSLKDGAGGALSWRDDPGLSFTAYLHFVTYLKEESKEAESVNN